MNNNFIRLAPIVLALIFSMGLIKAQTALTGSETPSDATVKQSDAIFIGQIEVIGPAVIKALGERSYYGVKVKVVTALKGVVGPEVSVALIARTDTKVPEVAPETNKSYIFFVKKKSVGSQFRVLKLLPADDALITQVKALIAAAPAGK